jgi:predicted dehydrogenase
MMKVALIGCGRWGKNLARVFDELGVLHMVCDPLVDVNAYPYTSCEIAPALMDEGVTAVAIATPPDTHYELAREALVEGKDVFVEKPMCLSCKEARDLTELAEARGLILMVGHLMLYHPAIRQMLGMVRRNLLGTVEHVSSLRRAPGEPRDDHVLWTLGSHDVAILTEMMEGKYPWKVSAQGDKDSLEVFLGYTDAEVYLDLSWVATTKDRLIKIEGTKGALLYNDEHESLLHDVRGRGRVGVAYGKREPLLLELEHFVTCCVNRDRPRTDGRHAVAVAALLDHIDANTTFGKRARILPPPEQRRPQR